MSTDTKYSWINQLDETLWPTIQNPVLGSLPPFPWEELSSNLGEALLLDSLTLSLTHSDWLPSKKHLTPFGKTPIIISIALAPLEGHAYWIFSQEDLEKLINWTVTQSTTTSSSPYLDQELLSGFQNFITLHLLSHIQPLPYLQNLTPSIAASSLPQETAYAFDIQAEWHKDSINTRLILSNTLRDQWYHHLKKQNLPKQIGLKEKNAQVTIHITIGECELSLETFNTLSAGDFVTLTNCSFDPETQQGTLTAHTHDLTAFKGTLQPEGKIEITQVTP